MSEQNIFEWLPAPSLSERPFLCTDDSANNAKQQPFSKATMSLPLLKRGVNEYLRRGVPASKLVLAMPW